MDVPETDRSPRSARDRQRLSGRPPARHAPRSGRNRGAPGPSHSEEGFAGRPSGISRSRQPPEILESRSASDDGIPHRPADLDSRLTISENSARNQKAPQTSGRLQESAFYLRRYFLPLIALKANASRDL